MFAQRPASNTLTLSTGDNYRRPLLLSFCLPLIFPFLSFISFSSLSPFLFLFLFVYSFLFFSLLSPYFFRSVFPSSFCLPCFHSYISYVYSFLSLFLSFSVPCLCGSISPPTSLSLTLSLSLSVRVSRSLALPTAHLLMFHLANVCTWAGHLSNIKTLSSLTINSVTRL